MGISIPSRRASSRVARVVSTPSATIRMEERTSSRVRPFPSSTPTVRFRLRSPVHVRIRSPIPDSPASVRSPAPRASASRVSSARPRVMRAAMVLWPKPSPATIPAASAITFFSAPPSSTPVTSWLV